MTPKVEPQDTPKTGQKDPKRTPRTPPKQAKRTPKGTLGDPQKGKKTEEAPGVVFFNFFFAFLGAQGYQNGAQNVKK